jgi:hypothetical protein
VGAEEGIGAKEKAREGRVRRMTMGARVSILVPVWDSIVLGSLLPGNATIIDGGANWGITYFGKELALVRPFLQGCCILPDSLSWYPGGVVAVS